jgi:hypothetical protein
MRGPRWTVQTKIVFPFTSLFILATLIVALVSNALIARTLDARLSDQLRRVSEMLAHSDFALNPTILAKIKQIAEAEIITYREDGAVLASTLDAEAGSTLLERLRAIPTEEQSAEGNPRIVEGNVVAGGNTYRVARRSLEGHPKAFIAIAAPTDDIVRTKSAITRSIAILTTLTVLLVSLLGHWIARSITRPIHQLVDFTRSVGAGDLSRRARVETRDEFGELVQSFNDMVAQLDASARELVHSEKLALTGQLAARVAHDVRNPLSSIKMQAQLLRTKLKPGQANEESLAAILRQIDRVESVVTGLLDLSRPVELELVSSQINDVVETAVGSAQAGLRHRKVLIQLDLASDLPALELDVERLSSALLNLITNAADAMPEGGQLTVITRLSSESQAICVEVLDEGIGIDPSVRGQLFDPFVTTKREGVGLGLLNTRSIVEGHHGSVELLPREQRGSRAVVTLPLV